MSPMKPATFLVLALALPASGWAFRAAPRPPKLQARTRQPLLTHAAPGSVAPPRLLARHARHPPPRAAAAPAQWDGAFRRRRLLTFVFTVVAYAAFYLTRNSLYYTAPAMVAAPEVHLPAPPRTFPRRAADPVRAVCVCVPQLGLDITSIGLITSIFPLFYGCSKFVSGVVGDVLSPRAMLSCGLALTATVNLRTTHSALCPRRAPPLGALC